MPSRLPSTVPATLPNSPVHAVTFPTMTAPGAEASVAQARILVARAVQDLGQTADRPVTEHVEVLAGVHRSLQDALAALDEV